MNATSLGKRLSLSGQVALVTGGTRGIGRSIALAFAEAGARVVVLSRSGEVEERSQESGIQSLKADVGSRAQLEAAVATVMDRHRRLDILVNNAGAVQRGPALEVKEEDWIRVLNLNLSSAAWASMICAPLMRMAGHGRIINITSVGGVIAFTQRAAYCSAKAGLAHLTRCLALEWAPFGITVNAIAPGLTLTSLTEPYLKANPDRLKKTLTRIPAARVAQPEEIASTALFLASDMAAYITGQQITVDGGWSLGDSDY